MMKKLLLAILCLALCLGALCGCSDIEIGSKPFTGFSGSGGTVIGPAPSSSGGTDSPKGAQIVLEGDTARFTGGGVSVSGSTVTIASPGSYTVSGTLHDGCIVVDTGEVKGDVTLTLNGADITCLGGPAIHVVQAKNFDLVLESGTDNRLVSGSPEASPAEKQDGAALFSEDDLDIYGGGTLEVFGYLNNGITCKDDLDIKEGTITVTALYNGVKGSESVEIYGGSLTITAGHDGLKATSAKKEGKGFVDISGGTTLITAGGDGVSAETTLTVSGGTLRVTTTGERDEGSCKALKAKTLLNISGGEVELDSADHALHSALDMNLSGGTVKLVSRAGKGLSAHGEILLSGCTLDVTAADDGIEAEERVTVSGGVTVVYAKGNGVKAGSKSGAGAGVFHISGGSVYVNAYGDPFEAKGGATISSGTFVGVGSPKTPKGFSGTGSQPWLMFSFAGAEGSKAEIWSAENELVDVIEARCGYTCAIYSSSALDSGTYTLECGTLKASAVC